MIPGQVKIIHHKPSIHDRLIVSNNSLYQWLGQWLGGHHKIIDWHLKIIRLTDQAIEVAITGEDHLVGTNPASSRSHLSPTGTLGINTQDLSGLKKLRPFRLRSLGLTLRYVKRM